MVPAEPIVFTIDQWLTYYFICDSNIQKFCQQSNIDTGSLAFIILLLVCKSKNFYKHSFLCSQLYVLAIWLLYKDLAFIS